ncbi:MAG: 2-hydroxyacyl-CoA dehydratase family protein [Clostridium sp.]|nr:2-hydroxyacyl-CoA dehydratase family protein [Clostridium sp.]
MALSAGQLQAKLMKDYYKDFSKYAKGRLPEHKVAWVTAFTPVEILEALEIRYFYPESYAAVIAASGKEQTLLAESHKGALCLDCCSYSCCFEGSIRLQEAPRGMPPKPDVLIATNNQCNTLPNWWNTLAYKFHVPLIVLDYPGEGAAGNAALEYVTAQHKELIARMEKLSGNMLDSARLSELLDHSERSVAAWNKIVELFPAHDIPPKLLFDGISFLIHSRCKPETAELYELQGQELAEFTPADFSKPGLFWLGYPLWYHSERYLSEILEKVRICGSNYITWWSLDYSGKEPFERLYHAYAYTFLNLTQKSKQARLTETIRKSGAVGMITLHNKSCKCDFVSARSVGLPQAEIEMDMIDREFIDLGKAKRQIERLLESI